MKKKFSAKAIEALGYYVYVYSDPDTGKPFYVGKGKGNRVFNHLDDQSESDKVQRIKEIKSRGKTPTIEILAHGLDEETAFKVEAAAIDLIGIENLTNMQRGHESSLYGKIEVSTLDARYSHEELKPDDVIDNIMFIRINKLYRNNMTPLELYEATRGYWRVKKEQAEKAKYVLSVYDGMVLEVYEVAEWLEPRSTFMERVDTRDDADLDGRYEFVGRIADDSVRKRYVGKSAASFFPPGNANPVKYYLGKDMMDKLFADRIKNESKGISRVTNDDLVCKDCVYRRDDSVRLGNTSVCDGWDGDKPNKVLLGKKCEKYRKE